MKKIVLAYYIRALLFLFLPFITIILLDLLWFKLDVGLWKTICLTIVCATSLYGEFERFFLNLPQIDKIFFSKNYGKWLKGLVYLYDFVRPSLPLITLVVGLYLGLELLWFVLVSYICSGLVILLIYFFLCGYILELKRISRDL